MPREALATEGKKPTTMNSICFFIRNLDAEFLERNDQPNALARVGLLTSSMAITTSTVSKLSRPKSFAKWDAFESFKLD